jgi:DsbC/DsbD-like thiol-disulfide interchange protein
MVFSCRRSFLWLTAVAMVACPRPASAERPAETHIKLELISEQATAPPGKPLWVGVLFRLDPGWHIYWQNPGDSGEPPKIQWALPPGSSAGSIRWPQPIRLGTGSIIDYGYEGQVLLMAPIEGPATHSATPIPRLSADVRYIVCRDVCIPGKSHLVLANPAGTGLAAWQALFEQTRAQLPKPPPPGWSVTAVSDKQHFILSVRAQQRASSASFFPLETSQVDNSSPQDFAPTRTGFRLTLRKSDQLTKPITTLRGIIVIAPGRAFDVAAAVAANSRE